MYFKYLLILLTALFLCSSFVYGKEKTSTVTIQSLVKQVKKAAPSERRVLMNELKIKLRSMNQESRKQVMLELRRSFNINHNREKMQGMTSTMQQQSASMMTEAKNMNSAMHKNNMQNNGMPGGGTPGHMHP
jgi:hypothetical protein